MNLFHKNERRKREKERERVCVCVYSGEKVHGEPRRSHL